MRLANHSRLLQAAAGFIAGLFLAAGNLQAETVVVSNAAELIDAINASADVIEVDGTITFDSPYQGSANALPVISDEAEITIRGRAQAALVAGASGFRLIEATGDADVTITNMEIRGFSSPGDGGAVLLSRKGILFVTNAAFIDNQAQGHGGAIYMVGGSPILNPAFVAVNSRFENNRAGGQGGAIHVGDTASSVNFYNNVFIGNDANAGCAVTLDNAADSSVFQENIFLGPCPHALLRVVSDGSSPFLIYNTWKVEGGKAYTFKVPAGPPFAATELFGNFMVRIGQSSKPLCDLPDVTGNTDPRLPFVGYNIATDNSCRLNEPTDLAGVDTAMVLEESALPMPVPKGPAVDAILPEQVPTTTFPCGAIDVNGLGRPQDGDGDGIFGCDIGAVEKQGGEDIGPAQTGAYFDPARNGEGYFVEILSNDLAWVTFFTYSAGRNHPQWFFGLGRVVGNSIVVRGFSFCCCS